MAGNDFYSKDYLKDISESLRDIKEMFLEKRFRDDKILEIIYDMFGRSYNDYYNSKFNLTNNVRIAEKTPVNKSREKSTERYSEKEKWEVKEEIYLPDDTDVTCESGHSKVQSSTTTATSLMASCEQQRKYITFESSEENSRKEEEINVPTSSTDSVDGAKMNNLSPSSDKIETNVLEKTQDLKGGKFGNIEDKPLNNEGIELEKSKRDEVYYKNVNTQINDLSELKISIALPERSFNHQNDLSLSWKMSDNSEFKYNGLIKCDSRKEYMILNTRSNNHAPIRTIMESYFCNRIVDGIGLNHSMIRSNNMNFTTLSTLIQTEVLDHRRRMIEFLLMFSDEYISGDIRREVLPLSPVNRSNANDICSGSDEYIEEDHDNNSLVRYFRGIIGMFVVLLESCELFMISYIRLTFAHNLLVLKTRYNYGVPIRLNVVLFEYFESAMRESIMIQVQLTFTYIYTRDNRIPTALPIYMYGFIYRKDNLR